MASQEERRAQTRKKILLAAGELFARQGVDKTTVVQIVHRANVVKGTFYQHFESKMDLLVELSRQDGADRVLGLIEKVKQGLSPLDALSRYYRAMAQWFEAHAPMAEEVIISAIRRHGSRVGQPEYSAHEFTQLMLLYAQERGEIRNDMDITPMAFSMGGAFTLAVVDWCRDPKESLLIFNTESCLALFLDGARASSNLNR